MLKGAGYIVPSSLYCTNCGVSNQAQAKFCFGCGHSLQGLIYPGHSSEATSVDWSTGGIYIASGSAEGVVQVWQASSNR
jgi:WD40 repeat protein